MKTQPVILDVVALLRDVPDERLLRGQVGTIVEELTDDTVLVEFADDEGQTYALAALPVRDLLVLRYEPARAA